MLPCLGVACCLHLEGDHLLHVDSDNLEEEKCRWCNMVCGNFGQSEHLNNSVQDPHPSSSFCRAHWLKLPENFLFNRHISYCRLLVHPPEPDCRPEHGSRISFWNAGTQPYYVVYKPEEKTIIWKIGKKCENLMWKVKFTIDSSCLTNGLSDSLHFLPATSCWHTDIVPSEWKLQNYESEVPIHAQYKPSKLQYCKYQVMSETSLYTA